MENALNLPFTVLGSLLLATACAAQGPVLHTPAAPSGTSAAASPLKVDVRLVNIPVVVHDKKGALVQDLTKDNFVLQVDGQPQAIRYFNLDTDLPLTLGLLVDTSLSQRSVLDDERTASTAFLEDMLNAPAARDKAFVIEFAREADLLQDLTSSIPKLQEGLKKLDSPSFGGGDSSGNSDSGANDRGGQRGSGRWGGGAATTLYDAVFLSSDELMSKQTGRKAVIILSDGVDRGSKETLAASIEAAQRADTIIYAIYFKGEDGGRSGYPGGHGGHGGGFPGGRGGGFPGGGGGYPGGGGRGGEQRPDGKKILQRMADETGGRLFEVSKKDTVASIYKQIGDELRAQYRLGYTPDEKTAADGYHQIELTLSKSSPKDLFIQTRDGYYTGK